MPDRTSRTSWEWDAAFLTGETSAATSGAAAVVPSGVGGTLASLQTHLGKYFTAQATGGGITVTRYEFTTPEPEGAAFSGPATSGASDTQPHLSITRLSGAEPGRLMLHFTRGGAVGLTTSDDEGQSWTTPASIMTGTHPAAAVGHAGEILRAALDAGTGIITGNIQYPGDAAPGADFTFLNDAGSALLSEDDAISLQAAYEAPARFTLFMRVHGETSPSTWASADDGRTWERVS